MKFELECEREEDGRWLAEVPQLPGVLAYGATAEEAMSKAEVLACASLPIASSTARVASTPLRSASPLREPVALDESSHFLRRCSTSGGRSRDSPGHIALSGAKVGRISSSHFMSEEEIGPKMLARIVKHTGLRPENL